MSAKENCMSTKSKIGKEWVKAQLVLAETGETLHLTFAPGETRKRVIAHIDGCTVAGAIYLEGLGHLKAPHDATVKLVFDGHAAPVPAPVVAPAAVKAPVAVSKPVVPAPEPVVVKTEAVVEVAAPVETAAVEVADSKQSSKKSVK